ISAIIVALLGFGIGVAGAFVIRYSPGTYLGLGLALAAFLFAALFTRALAGAWAFVPLVLGTVAGVLTTAFVTFGDDIILPLDRTSTIWLVGLAVLANVVGLLPRHWFAPSPADPLLPDDDGAPPVDSPRPVILPDDDGAQSAPDHSPRA
ncbi:MAG TPA: hypothetical protein GX743_02560, partial [Actinomycetales bacterium]|nr:hypothetical protein [Actinomycetales bacterium]